MLFQSDQYIYKTEISPKHSILIYIIENFQHRPKV